MAAAIWTASVWAWWTNARKSGGSYQGIPQNDLGIRTDILDCCPKAEGMMMLIRSMSPEVVAVDELGDYEDIHAIESVIHCGCRLFATVHGSFY